MSGVDDGSDGMSAPDRIDLTYADGPRYYVVPEAERPPCPAEPAPYDLDVIRTDVEEHFGVGKVLTPVRAGEVIPARIAHLPRRRCDHYPCCPHFAPGTGIVLVSPTWSGKYGFDR